MIETLVKMFSYAFLQRAFIVGLLVSLCASLLGVSLVLKRYSMIGDGLSHVGFGSLAIATATHLAPLAVSIPIVVAAAFLLLRLSENSKIKGDAAIAMISTGALAIGVVIISQTTGMNTDVSNYLFGSILTVTKSDAPLSIALGIVVLALFVVFYNTIFAITFDETFVKSSGMNTECYNMLIAFLTAITIVLGMRMMGAMLISSLIIFPSLTAMRLCKKFKSVTICSAIVSVVCYFLGLIISYARATPTGASVVILNIAAFLIFSLIQRIQSRAMRAKPNAPPPYHSEPASKTQNARLRAPALTLIVLLPLLLFASCQRSLGWGVLLWASENAGIPSGTPLRVTIKSNIDKVWVVDVPREYRQAANGARKIEIPLSHLELSGSKAAAQKRAKEFGKYAVMYAETLQDGLPMRESPSNSARRVYRLRQGEVIKILEPVTGTVAISATGDPLPGEWFHVLAEDGTQGFCFSYRLRLFDHTIGEIESAPLVAEEERDIDLENVLSQTWVAEVYSDMINENKLDIDALSKHWGFTINEDTGIAHILLPDIDQSFKYLRISGDGDKSWQFEGTTLRMHQRSPTILVVQFVDETGRSTSGMTIASGAQRTLLFIAIPTPVDDLIVQEETRRTAQYQAILDEGPNFASEYYGELYFTEDRDILWEDFELLIPAVLPVSFLGRGVVESNYFLGDELKDNYDGVLSLRLKTIGGPDALVNFLYEIDSGDGLGGLRLEYIPDWCFEDNTAIIRDTSPTVLYFYQTE
jgi:zinc transport system permease protein